MTVFHLLAVGFIMKFVAFIFTLSAATLILVVLIQKGKGGGLTGALGGGGGAGGILGSKTGDFLTWFTIVLAGLFLFLAVIMAKFYKPTVSEFGQSQPQQQTAAPAQQPQTQQQQIPLEQEAVDTNTPGQ